MHLLVWLFVYPKKVFIRTDFPMQVTRRLFNSKGEQGCEIYSLWTMLISSNIFTFLPFYLNPFAVSYIESKSSLGQRLSLCWVCAALAPEEFLLWDTAVLLL